MEVAFLQEVIKCFYVCVALKLWWRSDYSKYGIGNNYFSCGLTRYYSPLKHGRSHW